VVSLGVFIPAGDGLLDCLSRVNREELELAKVVYPLVTVSTISKVEGSTRGQPQSNVALLKFHGAIDDDQVLRLQVDLRNGRHQIWRGVYSDGKSATPAFRLTHVLAAKAHRQRERTALERERGVETGPLSGFEFQFVILQVNHHQFELAEKIHAQHPVYFLSQAF
jgi:hypothetical protein